MTAGLTGLWGVCAVLWLVTAPRFLAALARVSYPGRLVLVGWIVAALGWVAFPVCVAFAIASLAGSRPSTTLALLPVAALLVLLAGLGMLRLGTRIDAVRERRLPPVPPPPPLSRADLTTPRWTRFEFERLDDDARWAVLTDLADRSLAVWRTFLATTPGGTVSYAHRGRLRSGRRQVDDTVAYQALCDARRGPAARHVASTRARFDRDLEALRDGRLVVPERARHALTAVHALNDLRFGPQRAPETRREQEWRIVEQAFAALP